MQTLFSVVVLVVFQVVAASLATGLAVLAVAHWSAFARGVQPENLPAPTTYPDRGGDFALQVALSALELRDAASSLLDNKLAMSSGTAGALIALLTAIWAASTSSGDTPGAMESLMGVLAIVVFVAAVFDGVLGMRLDNYEEAPSLGDIRGVFSEQYVESDVQWVIVFSIERAIARNEWLIGRKQAAFRIVWILMLLGIGLTAGTGVARVMGW